MNVYRIPISLDPLLVQLGNLLLQAEVPRTRVEDLGDLRKDLDARDFSVDRPIPTAFRRVKLLDLRVAARELIAARAKREKFEIRGCHYCPAGGGLGWHTNSDSPGWRVYVVRPLEPADLVRSRLLGENGHHCHWEDPKDFGWANVFRAGEGSWHAVDAVTARMAVGMKVPEAWALDLIGQHWEPKPGQGVGPWNGAAWA